MKKFSLILLTVVVFNLMAISIVGAQEDQDIFLLDEMVVTASKHEEKLSKSPASIEVIDEEEIKKKSTKNIAHLLKNIASVQINDNGGVAGQKSISIRGSNSGQVLVLVDGQPMNSSQNGGVDLSRLTVQQIKKIEILRGPASALYGANALGGVVNIITKDGSEESETSAKLGYGSFSTQEYILSHRGSAGGLGYNLVLTKKKSDGHRENSRLDQENIFVKFDYELSNYSDLILSLQYNYSDKGVAGKSTNPSPNAKQDDQDKNINLRWERKSEKSDLNLVFYHNQDKQGYDNPDEWGYTGADEHKTKKTGLDFDQSYYFKNQTVTYGGELKKNEIDSSKNGEHENLNKAIFIQDKVDLGSLELTLGGRYDNHEVYGSEFSPRLGTVYTLNPKINLHASVGKAYRAPTFNDLYWPSDAYTEGNPDLESETAYAYEIGLRYLEDNFKGEVNLFKKDVEDLINWVQINPDDQYSKWRPSNVDSAQISGIELLLNKYFSEGLATDFNYTYLDAFDKESKEQLSYKPYHKANIAINYAGDLINLNLNGQLVAGRANELPSYFVMDTKLGGKVTENIEVSLEVNNFLDREYEVQEGYPMPERNYMLEVSTEF